MTQFYRQTLIIESGPPIIDVTHALQTMRKDDPTTTAKTTSACKGPRESLLHHHLTPGNQQTPIKDYEASLTSNHFILKLNVEQYLIPFATLRYFLSDLRNWNMFYTFRLDAGTIEHEALAQRTPANVMAAVASYAAHFDFHKMGRSFSKRPQMVRGRMSGIPGNCPPSKLVDYRPGGKRGSESNEVIKGGTRTRRRSSVGLEEVAGSQLDKKTGKCSARRLN